MEAVRPTIYRSGAYLKERKSEGGFAKSRGFFPKKAKLPFSADLAYHI